MVRIVTIIRIDYIYFSAYTFLGDSGVASVVINESLVEGEEARKFLEDVRVTYPQVCELNSPVFSVFSFTGLCLMFRLGLSK